MMMLGAQLCWNKSYCKWNNRDQIVKSEEFFFFFDNHDNEDHNDHNDTDESAFCIVGHKEKLTVDGPLLFIRFNLRKFNNDWI